MGKQCHRMRFPPSRKKLKRRRLFSERHFLDADAGLSQMRQCNSREEANGGDSGD